MILIFALLKSRYYLTRIITISSLLLSSVAVADMNESSIHYRDADIPVYQFPASGKYLVLWPAPAYGLRAPHRAMAELLAKQGIEVWLFDLLEALFLPYNSSSIRNLDGDYIAELIERANKASGKKIVLFGNSYGSISVLTGIHNWQAREPTQDYLVGAVLFSPNAYSHIPTLGAAPVYMPVVSATNVPVMIYQGEKNGNRWQLENLVTELHSGGSSVNYEILPGVNGLFFGSDIDQQQQARLNQLSQKLPGMIRYLDSLQTPLHAVTIRKPAPTQRGSGIDIQLKSYGGTVQPVPIKLNDAIGKAFRVHDYRGKVTLVNFWATWCPPCVEEIPSLNRLKQKMSGKAFELISINYAEDEKTIIEFLKKVNVDFTVLLDANGEYAKQWKVLAYPSTFVIGMDGQIKYGVNAALEWDSPQVVEKIEALLK